MGTSGLGALLVEEGLLSEADRRTIKRSCGSQGAAFARSIVSLGLLEEDELAAFLAERTPWRVAPKDLMSLTQKDVWGAVDRLLVERLEVLPLKLEGHTLHVAMVDPLDQDTIRQLAFFTGYKIQPVISTLTRIRSALGRLLDGYRPQPSHLEEFLENHANAASRRLLRQERARSRPPEIRAGSRKASPVTAQVGAMEDFDVSPYQDNGHNLDALDDLEATATNAAGLADDAHGDDDENMSEAADWSADVVADSMGDTGDAGAPEANPSPSADEPAHDLKEDETLSLDDELGAELDASFEALSEPDAAQDATASAPAEGASLTDGAAAESSVDAEAAANLDAADMADTVESMDTTNSDDSMNSIDSANVSDADLEATLKMEAAEELEADLSSPLLESTDIEATTSDMLASESEATLENLEAASGDISLESEPPLTAELEADLATISMHEELDELTTDTDAMTSMNETQVSEVRTSDLNDSDLDDSMMDESLVGDLLHEDTLEDDLLPLALGDQSEDSKSQTPQDETVAMEASSPSYDEGQAGAAESLTADEPDPFAGLDLAAVDAGPEPMIESEPQTTPFADAAESATTVSETVPETFADASLDDASLDDQSLDVEALQGLDDESLEVESLDVSPVETTFSPPTQDDALKQAATLNRALVSLTLATNASDALRRSASALVEAGLTRGLLVELEGDVPRPIATWQGSASGAEVIESSDEALQAYVTPGMTHALARLYAGWTSLDTREADLAPFGDWTKERRTLHACLLPIDGHRQLAVIAAWPTSGEDHALKSQSLDLFRRIAKLHLLQNRSV